MITGEPGTRKRVRPVRREAARKRTCSSSRHLAGRPTLQIRWPNAHYRAALCAVLGAARPADLGLYATRQGANPEVSELTPRPVTQLPARMEPAASPVAAAGVVNTMVRCTVEGTETGGVRIVVELGPGDPAVDGTSGSAAELSAVAEASA